jgi:isopenicillin-N epimerase
LYARPEIQHLLKPLVVLWGYESETPSGSTFIDHHEWWGTRDVAAFLTVPKAIEFQQEQDWVNVRSACHQLAVETWQRINQITGSTPLHRSAEDWFAQMTVSPLPEDTDIIALKNKLYEACCIEIPLIDWRGHKLIRLSVQGYNSKRDVDVLFRALTRLLT